MGWMEFLNTHLAPYCLVRWIICRRHLPSGRSKVEGGIIAPITPTCSNVGTSVCRRRKSFSSIRWIHMRMGRKLRKGLDKIVGKSTGRVLHLPPSRNGGTTSSPQHSNPIGRFNDEGVEPYFLWIQGRGRYPSVGCAFATQIKGFVDFNLAKWIPNVKVNLSFETSTTLTNDNGEGPRIPLQSSDRSPKLDEILGR